MFTRQKKMDLIPFDLIFFSVSIFFKFHDPYQNLDKTGQGSFKRNPDRQCCQPDMYVICHIFAHIFKVLAVACLQLHINSGDKNSTLNDMHKFVTNDHGCFMHSVRDATLSSYQLGSYS